MKTEREGKILYHLQKPKSRTEIVVFEDLKLDEDGWFLKVRSQKVKTGEITNEMCIIRKDIEILIDRYLRDGYVDILQGTIK